MNALPPDWAAFAGDIYHAVINPDFLSPLIAVVSTLAGVHMTNRHKDRSAARQNAHEELIRERDTVLSPLTGGMGHMYLIIHELGRLGRPNYLGRVTTELQSVSFNAHSWEGDIRNTTSRVQTSLVRERVEPFAHRGVEIMRRGGSLADVSPVPMTDAEELTRAASNWIEECGQLQREVEETYGERLAPYLPDDRPWYVRWGASARAQVARMRKKS